MFKYIVIKKTIKEKWIKRKNGIVIFYWSWKVELGGRERISSRLESIFGTYINIGHRKIKYIKYIF